MKTITQFKRSARHRLAALLAVAPIFLAAGTLSAATISPVFTYQGRLTEEGEPANGEYDFRFTLQGAEVGASQIGNTLTNRPVTVTDGVFNVSLDFGAGPFDGNPLWLELGVRANGSVDDYATLSPRQPITATPYALRAESLNGTVSAGQVTGSISNQQLPADVALRTGGNNFTGTQNLTGTLDVTGFQWLRRNWAAMGVRPVAAGQSSFIEFNNLTGARGLIGVDGPGFSGTTNTFSIATWSGHPLKFFTSQLQRMTIEPNGFVGIGTGSPTTPLAIGASGGSDEWLSFKNGAGDTAWHFNGRSGGFNLAQTGVADGRLFVASSGNVGIGELNPTEKLHVAGNIAANNVSLLGGLNSTSVQVSGTMSANVVEILGGADIAEPFRVSSGPEPEPGMVVAIDPDQPGEVRIAASAYDQKVAGIISGAGGIRAGLTLVQEETLASGSHPVALTGRVYCYVDADANGSVQPGDLLTTSNTPGHAMRVSDFGRSQGAILGKAMTRLNEGRGLVLVLVGLQ